MKRFFRYRPLVILAVFIIALGVLVQPIAGCTVSQVKSESRDTIDAEQPLGPNSYRFPTEDGKWTFTSPHEGRLPTGTAAIKIFDIGEFTFDTTQVKTVRPDIFQPGHFSAFDILAHLDERGDIDMEYHFDESANTHIIDTINGIPDWWYTVVYDAGWLEENAYRMDMYPYKNGTEVQVFPRVPSGIEKVLETFREEVEVLNANNGQVIIPEVTIRWVPKELKFENVVVTPHNIRSDMLQPGTITALDVLLSLGEQGLIDRFKITWYDAIGRADPVDNYFVEQVNEAEAYGGCGFVYEAGPREYYGFTGNHIHLSSDVRTIVSPEYVLYFWLCL